MTLACTSGYATIHIRLWFDEDEKSTAKIGLVIKAHYCLV